MEMLLIQKILHIMQILVYRNFPQFDKDGFYAQWPENIVSKPILQNTVVEAEYHVWIESVAYDIASQNDKPLFIAEGKFMMIIKLHYQNVILIICRGI